MNIQSHERKLMISSAISSAVQDELADGAGPSGDQQAEAPQPDALEQEAAAGVRPVQDEADCKLLMRFKNAVQRH